MRYLRILIVGSLLSFSAFFIVHAEEGSQASELPRFHKVTAGLYRGGQPGEDGFRLLKEMGVRTVINFRSETEEKAIVETLGMKYVHIPLNAWKRVPEDSIRTFLQILGDRANEPVFVHCRRGADRTGIMVGIYRVAFQGWDARRAYKEARTIGMRWWYRGLKSQLYRFAETWRGRSNELGGALQGAAHAP